LTKLSEDNKTGMAYGAELEAQGYQISLGKAESQASLPICAGHIPIPNKSPPWQKKIIVASHSTASRPLI